MDSNRDFTNSFKGFSKLSLRGRIESIRATGALSEEQAEYLLEGAPLTSSLGEKFIENMIGYFQVPMGVATNFRIDGHDLFIPMAVEETSIIAAASKTARWVRESGLLTTSTEGTDIIGQIQFAKIKDRVQFAKAIASNSGAWVQLANKEVAFGLVQRGGGVSKIITRFLDRPTDVDGNDPQENSMAVVHVYMNPCDAMGANLINQVCEFLKEPMEVATGEKVTMCILSNLVDSKITKARIELKDVDADLGVKIQEASIFAEIDPYRAATNNKGVLNGIDPILIATGNDWRAVEAGIHAYAARDGQYRSITKWRYTDGTLIGEFAAPLIVGTVGGVTNLHPMAKLSLQMMNIKSAQELSRIAAAVGLVQNLGALRALTTVGIIEGHMKLHIKNLAMGAGAQDQEAPIVQQRLEQILSVKKRISLSHAVEVLNELRRERLSLAENVRDQKGKHPVN
jgi:hydroxymethylglutaryl-CoA reductase